MPARFREHLFLSYSTRDNESLAKDDGWIAKLQSHLEKRLPQILGGDIRIWRDRPSGPANFEARGVLDQKLREIASMIVVMSPLYLSSEWCDWELQTFLKAADECGGIVTNAVRRIIKVVKEEVEPARQPSQLQTIQAIEFFERRPNDNRPTPLELRGDGSDDVSRKYRDKLEDLAYAVKSVLGAMGVDVLSRTGDAPGGDAMRVYLAETTRTADHYYQAVKRELGDRRYGVLPYSKLPIDDPDEYERRVRASLIEADISVHVIGFGGIRFGASGNTLVELQARLAEEVARTRELPRFFYIPINVKPENATDKAFLDYVREEAPHDGKVEIFEERNNTIDGFKLDLEGRIAELRRARIGRSQPMAVTRRIHLICTQQDLPRALELQSGLKHSGFDVTLPQFDGNYLSREHAELSSCDGWVILHRSGDEGWLREKIKDGVSSEIDRVGLPPLHGVVLFEGNAERDLDRFRNLYRPLRGGTPSTSTEIVRALGSASEL